MAYKSILLSVLIFLFYLRACLNFAQSYFESCFRGYFPAVVRSVAGYVTNQQQGKRPKKGSKEAE